MRAHHHQHRSRSTSIRPLLAVVLVALFAGTGSGCISPYGYKGSSVYSREDFVALVKAHPYNWGNMYYYGTNAKYHHFMTRVADVSGFFFVPVSELTLKSTRPVSDHLQEIHPEDGFRLGPGMKTWSAPEAGN